MEEKRRACSKNKEVRQIHHKKFQAALCALYRAIAIMKCARCFKRVEGMKTAITEQQA
jgi:hypothetical protein